VIKLKRLIADLCPTGVPQVKIDELIAYEQPTKYLVASKSYDDSFPTPVLTAGQSFLLGYTNEEHGKYPASVESPVIIFDDFTTAHKWVDFEFKVKSSAMKMLTLKAGAPILLRYFWYSLSTIQIDTSEHARYWISKISNLEIPLPPLEIQSEIVKILDTFTQLEAELEKELVARSSQFNYFKDILFNSNRHRKLVSLESICTKITSGGTPATSNRDFYTGSIPWVRTSEVNFRALTDTEIHISEEALNQSAAKWIPAQSVVMAMVGATIGKVAYTEIDVTTNQNCCNLIIDSKKADYRFVFFWLWSQYEVIKSSSPGAVPIINSSAIKRLQIPLPPLAEQKKIARTLASLQDLIQSSEYGLPAEIKVRRQQYEHYRDKLLRFEDLVSA